MNNHTIYRVIKTCLCTWWLQYKKHAKNVKQFQSLTMTTWLKLGITDGVSVSRVYTWPWRSAASSQITCNFLYCNHQVHRDFYITLYIPWSLDILSWHEVHAYFPWTPSSQMCSMKPWPHIKPITTQSLSICMFNEYSVPWCVPWICCPHILRAL
jgi:hypothetical protein